MIMNGLKTAHVELPLALASSPMTNMLQTQACNDVYVSVHFYIQCPVCMYRIREWSK